MPLKRLAAYIGSAFLCVGVVCAQDAAEKSLGDLEEMREQFTELWNDVPRPMSEFDALYLSELEKAAKEAQDEGELLLLVAIKEEIKVFPTRGPLVGELSEYEPLARLQKIYNENHKKIEADSREKRIQLIVAYRKQIEELQKELTKAGEIEKALKVHEEGERMKKVFSNLVNNFDSVPSLEPDAVLKPDTKPEIPARPVVPDIPTEPGVRGRVGRYVRIVNPKEGILFISEFEVMSGEVNIAPRGKVSQSSGLDGIGGPELAIDGIKDGDFAKGSVSQTLKQRNPWWEVDLGREYNISQVKFYTRTDNKMQDHLSGMLIIIYDEDRRVVNESEVRIAPEYAMTITFK